MQNKSVANPAIISLLIMDVFDDILKIEENALRHGAFSDTSVTEMHTVGAIGMYEKPTMSEVAKKLKITVGTLTVAINNLVKKGYVERLKIKNDRRVVVLSLTNRGRLLYRIHDKFHKDMVKHTVSCLSDEEETVLIKALTGLHNYLTSNFLL